MKVQIRVLASAGGFRGAVMAGGRAVAVALQPRIDRNLAMRDAVALYRIGGWARTVLDTGPI